MTDFSEKFEPEEFKPEESKPSSSSRRLILFALLGLVITGLIIKVIIDYKKTTELTAQYEGELKKSKEKLTKISIELKQKIADIDSLGGDITELLAAQKILEIERVKLLQVKEVNRDVIVRLNEKTEGYEKLLKAKDREITRLRKVAKVLLKENKDIKIEKEELSKSIISLNKDKKNLEHKVEIASKLKVEEIKIFAVSKKNKMREKVFKRRQINKLKIVFNISKNDLAPLENKKIFIRVTDQNNQIIFDIEKGSSSFMLDGKETFFTASQDILFDNTKQEMAFLYNKGSMYIPGEYKIEVFTDGYLMGAKKFIIKK